MSRASEDYLYDIRDRIRRILDHTKSFSDCADLEKDEWALDAVIRNLEIIGEAAKKLPDELCIRYPEVPWREMKALRDWLAHQYFQVSVPIVWDIVRNELPGTLTVIGRIIDEVTGG